MDHPKVSLPRPLQIIFVQIVFVATLSFSSAWAQSVTTQHYDNNRTGINPRESVLTTGNVGSGIFGKLYTRPVDGHIYAQPLYVPKVFEIFDHTGCQ
jgi:hypothetical protein